MVLLRNCQVHNKPAHLICAMHESPLLLCEKCMAQHQLLADHHTAISLNNTTLNYFTLFTMHIASNMLHWSHIIQNNGFKAVFGVRTKDGGFWRCEDEAGVGRCALRVVQQHAELMQNNNRYVTSNQETEGLYHPECLKDIYNLAAQHWQANAQLLLIKFEALLWEHCEEEFQKARPVASIHNSRIAQIQSYRQELLSKWREDIFNDSKGQFIEKRLQSEETIGSQRSKASCRDGKEVSQFQVAQLALQHANEESLQRQNKLLREENASLKCENVLLRQDCNILREKCLQLQSQRRHPSSSKKRSEVSLQSQLLSEIVELQSQLNDSQHDLQLLITFLNELASRNLITPLQLKQRLLPLKTVTLH